MTMHDEQLKRWPFSRTDPLDPPSEYAEFRKQEGLPEVCLWNGDRAYLATRYEDVRTVLRAPEFSVNPNQEGFPSLSETAALAKKAQLSMSRMDPPRHDDHRRMVAKDFTVVKVAEFKPFIEEMVDHLFDEMERSSKPVDLVRALAEPVPSHVTCKLLDLPTDQAAFFQDRVNTFMSHDVMPQVAAEANTDILNYFERMIDERSEKPGTDMISRLIVEEVKPGKLGADELKHMLHLLLIGGFDTAANMIALGVLTFFKNPDQLQALKSDPDLVNGAVEELLRYLSVAHYTAMRMATTDAQVGSKCVHARERIIGPIPAANRDPAVFADPDKFDIRREARRHLAFGFGLHQCLGQTVARLELQIVFGKIFKRFPNLRLAVPESELKFRNSLIYGIEALPVTW